MFVKSTSNVVIIDEHVQWISSGRHLVKIANMLQDFLYLCKGSFINDFIPVRGEGQGFHYKSTKSVMMRLSKILT